MKGFMSFDPAVDYGRARAATYDERVAMDVDTEGAVACLAELAGGGPILELGVGTGRVALHLAEKGLTVTGLDTSRDMLSKLREQPGSNAIRIVHTSMDRFDIADRFSLIYCIYNTLFWLIDQDSQRRCVALSAAHLAPGGRLVIETDQPDLSTFIYDRRVSLASISDTSVALSVAVHDPLSQVVTSQLVTLDDRGLRLEPMLIRYAGPSEIDLMASSAGLEKQYEWADWLRTPFTGRGNRIGVYART